MRLLFLLPHNPEFSSLNRVHSCSNNCKNSPWLNAFSCQVLYTVTDLFTPEGSSWVQAGFFFFGRDLRLCCMKVEKWDLQGRKAYKVCNKGQVTTVGNQGLICWDPLGDYQSTTRVCLPRDEETGIVWKLFLGNDFPVLILLISLMIRLSTCTGQRPLTGREKKISCSCVLWIITFSFCAVAQVIW